MAQVRVTELRREGDQLVIEWSGQFARYQVQRVSGLGETWENLGEPTSGISQTEPIGRGPAFFRVVGLMN